MKKFQPMLKKFNKGKEKLHDLLSYQNNDKDKFGLGFDENSAKKVSKKSKLEEVFIKKQPSFKNCNNSNKDSVYNKSSSINQSHHILNNKSSYSRKSNDRFLSQNSSNSRNFYSKGRNLRFYDSYTSSIPYKSNLYNKSSQSYNAYYTYARNDSYAFSNRRYNNHTKYANNDFYQYRRN